VKAFLPAAVAILVVFTLTGCDSPERSIDSARKAVAEFQASPTSTTEADAEKQLAKIEARIDDLAAKGGDPARVEALRREAASLRADFQAARMAKALLDAKSAIEGIGNAVKDATKSFTDTLKNANETNAN